VASRIAQRSNRTGKTDRSAHSTVDDPSTALWISGVREAGPALSPELPIGMRRNQVWSGPVAPTPERHPYCECNILIEGEVTQYCGNETIHRKPGDILLVALGLPHWALPLRCPVRSLAIYFLPNVLVEMGPRGDGLNLLQRFSASGHLNDRAIRPAPKVAQKMRESFAEFAKEFELELSGREIRLRAILAMLLTDLDRYLNHEEASQRPMPSQWHWERLQLALLYLQEHYQEPIYSRDLSKHLAMSESGIRTLFRRTIGIAWGRYLQTYRVHQAATLFATGQLNVTEVASAVGFESLNHFERIFRSVMGETPRDFARNCRQGRQN
jgi:AraC-like DNA-binding protein/mannose-6-phosphate isomerase-like protein (cupin superfamily)